MKTAWVLYADSQPFAYNVASLRAALERKNFSVSCVDIYDLRVDPENQIRHCVTHEIYSPPDIIIPANGIRVPVSKFDLITQGASLPQLPSYEQEHKYFMDKNFYLLFKTFHANQSVKIIESWPSFKPHSLIAHIQASNKDDAFRLFRENNVATARTVELPIDLDDNIKNIIKTQIGEPFVVKSAEGSNGEGTEYCATVDNLSEVCALVQIARPGGRLLAQEYISHSLGMVLTVGVVGDKIFPVARIGTGGFKTDTQEGRIQIAFKQTKKLQDLTVAARKALNLEYLRFDMMIGEDGEYKIIEANSPGGMNIVSCTHNQEFATVVVDHTLKLFEASNAT